MNENLRKDNNLYEWKQTGGGGIVSGWSSNIRAHK